MERKYTMYKFRMVYALLCLLLLSLIACKSETPPVPAVLDEPRTAFVKSDSINTGKYIPGTWITDYQAALAFAKSENKTVLADFTGSDWCSWCKKLDKEVFSQKPFLEYATQNLVLLKLDFPRSITQPAAEKAQNEALAQQYEIQGFPTIMLFDKEGKKLGQTGYQAGGAAMYVKHLEGFLR